MSLFTPKKRQWYGISENQEHYCIAEVGDDGMNIQWRNKSDGLLPFVSGYAVKSLPCHIIWRRVFFLPKSSSHAFIYQQIIRKMQQELPVEISDLQFDYQIHPLDTAWRVALFAVRRAAMHPLTQEISWIFDCELHCIARALLYLNRIPNEQAAEFCYPFEDKFFFFDSEGLKITAIQPEKLPVLQEPAQSIPPDMLDHSLYIKAVGAALWNGTASI